MSSPPMKTNIKEEVTEIAKISEADLLAKSTFPEQPGFIRKPIESGSYATNPFGIRVYQTSGIHEGQLRRGLRKSLKGGLLLSVVCGYYLYQITSHPEGEYVASPNATYNLQLLPMRKLSRYWGYFAESDMSKLFIKPYAAFYECNVNEASEPLESYGTLQQFFTRFLKDGSRPFSACDDTHISSPCDSTLVRMGEVTESNHEHWISQIKGYQYRVTDLLRFSPKPVSDGSKRVYCVLYLGPGDYHRFHVPVDSWKVSIANHIIGNLFPVNTIAYKFLDELFCMNERISLNGTWKHGSFCCSLVGAYNVGNIVVGFDKGLATQKATDDANARNSLAERQHVTTAYSIPKSPGKGGDELGYFKMGSTIVMIADVPQNWKWNVSQGDKTKVGEILMSKSA